MCTPGVSNSLQHIKSIFLDFYRGEEMIPGSGPGSNPGQPGLQVALKGGLQHIISISEGPSEDDAADGKSQENKATIDSLEQLYRAGALKTDQSTSSSMVDTSAVGRVIHFRVYAIVPPSNGSAPSASTLELEEIGPSMDFVLRRRQMAEMAKMSASLRRPKTQSEKNRQGKGVKKNIETNEMGDKVGRVHIDKQDLGKLQTRKMKGLKRARHQAGEEDGEDEDEGSIDGDSDNDAQEEVDLLEDVDDEASMKRKRV
jgi:ribosome production factor 2